MDSLPVSALVQGTQYRIYSNGGCKEMETTAYKTFIGINNEGYASFYDDSMQCPVVYIGSWVFYRI
jgi:hypothetical protein